MKNRYLAAATGLLLTALVAVAYAGNFKGQTAVCVFDLAAASATPILTSSLTPDSSDSTVVYAITISLDSTDSVVNFTSSDGTTTYKDDLNNGTALTAGRVYTFTVGACRASTNNPSATLAYNFECETTTRIRRLQVDVVRSDSR